MNSQRTLLIIAHGSRALSANQEFLDLVDVLRPKFSRYNHVKGVFLELCEPSLAHAVKELMTDGQQAFDVYPMFFNCGKHVKKDIPNIVENLRAEHSNLDIRLLKYFGSSELLANAMLYHVEQQAD